MRTEKKNPFNFTVIALLGLGGMVALACILSCLFFSLTATPKSPPVIYATAQPLATADLPTEQVASPTPTTRPLPAIPSPTPTPTPAVVITAVQPARPVVICDCSEDKYNCSDFTTHARAQACHDYCIAQGHGDVHSLDGDGDGQACVSLP